MALVLFRLRPHTIRPPASLEGRAAQARTANRTAICLTCFWRPPPRLANLLLPPVSEQTWSRWPRRAPSPTWGAQMKGAALAVRRDCLQMPSCRGQRR